MPPLPNYHFNATFSGSNFSSCTLFPKLIILSSQDLFTCLNFSVLAYHLYSFCCIINHSLMQWFKAIVSDFAIYPIKEPAKELASLDWAWWGALLHSLSEEELDLYNGKSLIMLHGFTTEPRTTSHSYNGLDKRNMLDSHIYWTYPKKVTWMNLNQMNPEG